MTDIAQIPADDFSLEYLRRLSHKTPFFLFKKKLLRNNLKEFEKAFPKPLVHYAMKANSEPKVLKVLAGAGAGFEVASIYELAMLKKLKVPPSKIIYGTSVKPLNYIKVFADYGVDRFAFDSKGELEKIAVAAPSARVYVRASVNDTGSVFKFSEKFGTDPRSIVDLFVEAKKLGLKPYGISFHVGSQATNERAWAQALQTIHPAITELKKRGIVLDVLNLGGGYPCQYITTIEVPRLTDIATSALAEYKKLPYKPRLILEPGRGIVANTCVLIAQVIARVRRERTTWLFLDAGVYNGLFETMAYQGSTRYPIKSLREVHDQGESLFAIAGPTGDSPDIVSREVLLPSDMAVGDRLVVYNAGAYSLSVTSQFNGFPKPDVYFV